MLISDHELSRFMQFFVGESAYNSSGNGLQPIFRKLSGDAWLSDFDWAYKNNKVARTILDRYLNSGSKLPPLQEFITQNYNYSRLLFIPAHTNLAEPISLSEIIKQASSIKQLFIIVSQDAYVTIVDQQTIRQAQYFQNIIGILEPSSTLKYILDQESDSSSTIVQHLEWDIQEQATLKIVHGLTSGKSYTRNSYNLNGEHASIEHVSLSVLKAQEQAAIITYQDHKKPNTKSSVEVKSLLLDQSRFFYRGTIAIDQNGNKSEARQYQKALLLSSGARNCAIPSLEVKTDEVTCMHGSAAGHICKDLIWFFQSRGLNYDQATNLVIRGFFEDFSLYEESQPLLCNLVNRLHKYYQI